MAWADVTLETDTWADVTDHASFVTDQNEDVVTAQDGTPINAQAGISTEWTTIT